MSATDNTSGPPQARPRRRRGRPGPRRVFEILLAAQGPSDWWPGESAFEVCVGAILVQNTAWQNAARALEVLRSRGLLQPAALARLDPGALAELLRPAGTYRVKARRLLAFVEFLQREAAGRVEALAGLGLRELRTRLLAVDGIGPETADCVILYAVGLPVFVVDAYTRRILVRLGLCAPGDGYHDVQRLMTRRLPRETPLFNEFHAQFVRLGQAVCRTRPSCGICPLEAVCARHGVPASLSRRQGGRT